MFPRIGKSNKINRTLSLKQELALAILLWKFMRSSVLEPGKAVEGNKVIPNKNLVVANLAIDMAKESGVKDEFFEALFDHPILNILVKEIEPWEDSDLVKLNKERKLKPKKPGTKYREKFAAREALPVKPKKRKYKKKTK